MKLTQDFNLNEFPFYFLKKKRTLYLKNLYKKKRKYYYFLVSRRKSIKLFSKRYNLNYYLHYEHYHNERKILKYFYHFTMNTGLKEKIEIKEKYDYQSIIPFERLQLLAYENSKLFNLNFNNNWFFFKYFKFYEFDLQSFNFNIFKATNKNQKKIMLDYAKTNNKTKQFILNDDNIIIDSANNNMIISKNKSNDTSLVNQYHINIRFNNKKNNKYYNKYINKNKNKYINNNVDIVKDSEIKSTNFFVGLMPNYSKWYYIYNIFVPNIKFKYLYSYNTLTCATKRKFGWNFFNNKKKEFKKKLIYLKLKNNSKFLYFYTYLFYYNLFNSENILKKQYSKNFLFFFNTTEYFILTNYLSVTFVFKLSCRNFLYYFNNLNVFNISNNIQKINFVINQYIQKMNYFIKNNQLFLMYFYFLFYLKIKKLKKLKNILKINIKHLAILKKKKKKINTKFMYLKIKNLKNTWVKIYFYYYLFLLEFILNYIKYFCNKNILITNNLQNVKLYYSAYVLKLFWILNKLNK